MIKKNGKENPPLIKGFKNTRARQAVIEILKKAESPMTAEDIFLSIREQGYSTNLSTVYRNLELMESRGMVEKTVINDNKSRYELSGNSHRHHIVCTECHKMVPISKCPFKKLESDIEMETEFDITGHHFILYGLCPKCKKQGQ